MKPKTWVLTGAAALVAATATGGVVAMAGGNEAAAAAPEPPPNTAEVVQGTLSDMVSLDGTLTYRARSDGSPYAVVNQARGIITELPDAGDKIACGDVIYRVDDRPVLMLCGPVPTYRALRRGDAGPDVHQLNENLHQLGHGAGVDPGSSAFTAATQRALEKLQRDKGAAVTGTLDIDAAVFLPAAVRVATVAGQLGGPAQPGAGVATATSDTPEVQADLAATQQGAVQEGDRAQITLPGNVSVTGRVERLGRVAQLPAGQDVTVGAATIPAYITLDDPGRAGGLDRAPVRVDVTTSGVESALSVPVTALLGRSGGFAVEVLRGDGRRELVAARLGLFDTSAGRVQVDGDLHEGDLVVVPSS